VIGFVLFAILHALFPVRRVHRPNYKLDTGDLDQQLPHSRAMEDPHQQERTTGWHAKMGPQEQLPRQWPVLHNHYPLMRRVTSHSGLGEW
jgi:hypothetical protein